MQQTPVHEIANMDIVVRMSPSFKRIVEVGSSSGAIAREYKKNNPHCHYTGIEIDADYGELSKRHCDRVLHASIESMNDETFRSLLPTDCWIFADVLEHLVDPWSVLKRIRESAVPGTQVLACIPNLQHWSLQVNINRGTFHYTDSGLLDRTHLRWFTRLTAFGLFHSTGFTNVEGWARVFPQMEPQAAIKDAIAQLARASGSDPISAVTDATAFQWIVRATV